MLATQPASAAHVVAHWVVSAQTYGEHCPVVDGLQMPRPLQAWPVCVPAAHVVAPQATPAAYCLQAWLPSQSPFFLHVVAPSSAHSPSGSVSTLIAAQMPFAPEPFLVTEQASHVPAQALSQQKPSTQLPLVHCDAAVQPLPLAWSLWQVLSERQ